MPQFFETVIRSICIIVGLFMITKLLGKKQLSGLSFFEYIVGITVGDIAGTLSMDGELSLIDGVTSIIIWSFFPLLISVLSLKSKWFRYFVSGKPTIFIENGKILEDNLRKEKFTIDELLEQLRKRNVFQVSDVEYALLDTNGELGIYLKRAKQPLTVGDIFPETVHLTPPETVIMDGKIEKSGLVKYGLTTDWLRARLIEKGLTVGEVFFAQVDKTGELTLDTYKDTNEEKLSSLPSKIIDEIKAIKSDLARISFFDKGEANKLIHQRFMSDLNDLEARISFYLETEGEKTRN